MTLDDINVVSTTWISITVWYNWDMIGTAVIIIVIYWDELRQPHCDQLIDECLISQDYVNLVIVSVCVCVYVYMFTAFFMIIYVCLSVMISTNYKTILSNLLYMFCIIQQHV